MTPHSPLRRLLLSGGTALAGAAALLGLPSGGTVGTPAVALPIGIVAPAPLPTEAAARPEALPPPAAKVLAQQRAAGLDCRTTPQDVPLCVHGDDTPQRPSRHVAEGASGSTRSGGRIGCYGDGTSGPRVRAVYARPAGAPDRYAASLPSIRGWAAGVSSQIDASAARTGGRRHVRYATTAGPSCTLTVLNVVLPESAFRSFSATIDALEQRGHDAPSSKYLVWSDASGVCGMATTYADDRPGLENLNNSWLPAYARIDRSCWGKVETHELVHMLGGVQRSAPNATEAFHCNDGLDAMCYDDGSRGARQRAVCARDTAHLLDCRNDDYFSTAAPKGSYLQTHWNTARSSFLSAVLDDGPVVQSSPVVASPAPSPTPSASPSRPLPVLHVEDPAALLPTLAPVARDLLGEVAR